jgi:type II secretory pathway pseudopilin PulG
MATRSSHSASRSSAGASAGRRPTGGRRLPAGGRGSGAGQGRGRSVAAHASARQSRRRSSVRLHWGRFALLVLVLLAAALYVGPLREFFAQQDRYQKESATLQALQQQNQAYRQELASTRDQMWIIRTAREDFQLVPPNMQAFVVEGLPQQSTTPRTQGSPTNESLSLGDRLKDLWRTITH